MGNIFSSKPPKSKEVKPKKSKKMHKNVFEREKERAQKRLEEIKKNADLKNRRIGGITVPEVFAPTAAPELFATVPPDQKTPTAPPDPYPPTAPPGPSTVHGLSSYDEMALNDMRYQLNYDANAFLLNNILLSVQFFENYEREVQQINDKPISERENLINNAMLHYNKHVLFTDRLLECVSEHVNYQKNRGQIEPLASPKLYVIYDNVEAREPGDTSDYSAAFDAPFYKLQIEDCKESGFLKLVKQEVLKSNLLKKKPIEDEKKILDDIADDDSGNKFDEADDKFLDPEDFSVEVNSKIENDRLEENHKTKKITLSNLDYIQSSPMQAIKENVSKNEHHIDAENIHHEEAKPKKSILKKPGEFGAATRYKGKDRRLCHQNNIIGEESECGSSGYGSILSGGSSVTESAVPKRIELHPNYASSSGVLSDECWTTVVKTVLNDSDDEDEKKSNPTSKQGNVANNWSDADEMIDSAYKAPSSFALHKQYHYLNSLRFMNDFIINFKQDLGRGLGFSQADIRNAMTHGASIYCDFLKESMRTGYEIIPGLTAAWPNAAYQWTIRKRKIRQNPRNNYKYQWPVNHMIHRARNYGSVLIPLGLRPKIGTNPDQKLQWRITFPGAERFLESSLAHSHIRCYLFTLALHKTFMENDMMVGIDASHIKNHLFWQCEDNFAKWPEDRLGESLRLFLESFYIHFAKSRLPNYFIESCNDFENIPASVLLILQRKLKDILESPVTHMLNAMDKLKYNSIGFYPTFDSQRLYEILTSKNPLLLSNPNLLGTANSYDERQRKKIRTNTQLPKSLGPERRHLVLKFFIPHFVAMARSSEKFEAVNQAMIYLEQAQRLCWLLLDEPGGDSTAEDYLEIIREKLTDCQRKIANEQFKLSTRQENTNRSIRSPMRQRPKKERVRSQDYLAGDYEVPSVTIADVHVEKPNVSVTQGHKVSSSYFSNSIQRQKEPKTKNHGVSTTSSADSYGKKHSILLIDSVIEETYL